MPRSEATGRLRQAISRYGVRLAVDGGATTLLMGLVDDVGGAPRLSAQVSVPGFQWTTGEDPLAQQCRRVSAAWDALGRPAPVEVVALGLAGGADDRPSRERLAPLVAERLGARKVLLTGDDVTTHLGVLGGTAGVVIAAGTGVACLAVTPDGKVDNVDGLGYLFGDCGGGFSLGLAGIRAALAGLESRGTETALTGLAQKRIGTPLRDAIKGWYGSPTMIADVADFASEVAGAAREDSVARVLCVGAGEALAVTVAAACRRSFPAAGDGAVPVSWAGGLLTASAVFDAFQAGLRHLCPAAATCDPQGGSLDGAVHLAAGTDVPHLTNVVVYERAQHASSDEGAR
jgi:glucosamine kinase